MKQKMTEKWRKKAGYYHRFASEDKNLDFSEQAAEAMFVYESRGGEKPKPDNGFFRGKMAQDITTGLWKRDILDRLLSIEELVTDYDPEFLTQVLS